jgi:hypothetical protein
MDHVDRSPVESAPADLAGRLRSVRARLPGQMLRDRIEMASVCYGPLYTLAELRRKAAETLAPRIGFIRGARLEPIETHDQTIPDEALLKYDEAFTSGLFSTFWVVTPTYFSERQVDPVDRRAGAGGASTAR